MQADHDDDSQPRLTVTRVRVYEKRSSDTTEVVRPARSRQCSRHGTVL